MILDMYALQQWTTGDQGKVKVKKSYQITRNPISLKYYNMSTLTVSKKVEFPFIFNSLTFASSQQHIPHPTCSDNKGCYYYNKIIENMFIHHTPQVASW